MIYAYDFKGKRDGPGTFHSNSTNRVVSRWSWRWPRCSRRLLNWSSQQLVRREVFLGIVIADWFSSPKRLAPYRATKANRLQTSTNLAPGSVLATIALTVPAVAGASILLKKRVTLGLGAKEELQLA